jgi:Tfp pilus assembly protein PilE
MAKLEIAVLVGAESKQFLAALTAQIDRLEKFGLPKETDHTSKEDLKSLKEAAEAEFDSEVEEDDEADDFMETKVQTKAKKLTINDVNDACKSRAMQTGGKEGRNEVLSILKKKFKATSVSELKPEQYAAAISAMGI